MSGYVSASRVEFDTTGICNIEGTIKSIAFEEAFEDPCVKDNSCPVGAFVPERSATYYLTIEINSLSCVPGEENNTFSYEAQFQLDAENIISIAKNKVQKGDVFEPGDNISGTVQYIALQHAFTSYELFEKVPQGNVISDDIDEQNNIINDDQQKSKSIPFLFVGSLAIIVLIIIAWFLLKKRKQN